MAIAAPPPLPRWKSKNNSLNNRFDRALNEHAPMYARDRHPSRYKRARTEDIEDEGEGNVKERDPVHALPLPRPPAQAERQFYHAHTRTGIAARRGVGGIVAGTSVKMVKPVPNWLADVLDLPVAAPPSPHQPRPFSLPGISNTSHHSSPSFTLPSSPLARVPSQLQISKPVARYAYTHDLSEPLPYRQPPPEQLQVAYSTPSYDPPQWQRAPPPSHYEPVYQSRPGDNPPVSQDAVPYQPALRAFPPQTSSQNLTSPGSPYEQSHHRSHNDFKFQRPQIPDLHFTPTPAPYRNAHIPLYGQEAPPPTLQMYHPEAQTTNHHYDLHQRHPSRPPPTPASAYPPALYEGPAPALNHAILTTPYHSRPLQRPPPPAPFSSSPVSRFTINTNFGGIPPSLSQAQAGLYSGLPPEKRRKMERKNAERLAGLQMVKDLEDSVEAMSMEESMSIDIPRPTPQRTNLASVPQTVAAAKWNDEDDDEDPLALKSGDEFDNDVEGDKNLTPATQRLLPIKYAPSASRFRVSPSWSSPSYHGTPEPRSSPLGEALFSIGSPEDTSTPLKAVRRVQVGDKRKHMQSKGTQTPIKAHSTTSSQVLQSDTQYRKRRKLSARAIYDGAEYVPSNHPSSDSGFSTPSSSPPVSPTPSPPPPKLRQMKITEGAWRPYALPIGDPATPRMLPAPTTWEERQAMSKINGHPVVNHEEEELVSTDSEVEDIENWSETDQGFAEDEAEMAMGGRMLRRLSVIHEEAEEELDGAQLPELAPQPLAELSSQQQDAEEQIEDRGTGEEIEEFPPSQDEIAPPAGDTVTVPTSRHTTKDQDQILPETKDTKALLPIGWEELLQNAPTDAPAGKRVRFRSRSSSFESDSGSVTEVDEGLTPPPPKETPRKMKKKKRVKYSPNPPDTIPKKGCLKPSRAVLHNVGFAIYRDGY